MASKRGIDANPHKVEAILRLTEPLCIKDIQRLNGCVVALGRFISKSIEKCMSFFKALKLSSKTFQWDESCTEAWKGLKDYLKQLPILCAPTLGEILYIYLSASDQTIA